jgi:hypothetical protein
MRAIAKVLARDVAALSPRAQRRAMGVIHCLAMPGFWQMLRDSWCHDGSEAAHAAAWAVRALIDEIRRNPASLEDPAHPDDAAHLEERPVMPAKIRRGGRAKARVRNGSKA